MKKINFDFRISVNVRVVRRICDRFDWRKILKFAVILIRLYLLLHGHFHHPAMKPSLPFQGEGDIQSPILTTQT